MSVISRWSNGLGWDINWGHSGSAEVWSLPSGSYGVRTFGPDGEPHKCAVVRFVTRPMFDMANVATIAHHDGALISEAEEYILTSGKHGRKCPVLSV